MKKLAMNTERVAWPDGNENTSGPTVTSISGVLPAGRLRRVTAFVNATITMSSRRPAINNESMLAQFYFV